MSHADDYRELLRQLLRRRWAEGPLEDEVECDYTARFEDIWDAMTPDERETQDQWTRKNRIHAVVFEEGDGEPGWAARCLAYNIVGKGTSKRAAIEDLKLAVVRYAHLLRQPVLTHVHPPPPSVIDWAVGKLIARIMLRGTKGDELLFIEPEQKSEAWTLYVVDLS